ncbi:MAG: S26 family signal peptidase [Spirochaetaceae bacterium]|jgi:signal peptidase I|nr:S26 family signal peptidase [Spirochaetaceae bacterium]
MTNPGRAILGAFCIALIMKVFLFDFMVAEGRSMLPAIQPGTVMVVLKTAYGLRLPGAEEYLFRWSQPKPGEVIIFYAPDGVLAVKRCASVPEAWTFIVLGDNSKDSKDSRSYGPIGFDCIIGKVLGM